MASAPFLTAKIQPFGGGTFPLYDLGQCDPATNGGAANELATNSGSACAWAQLTDAFVSSSAAISTSKLAPGPAASSTLLTSNGTTNSFAQLTDAFVSSSAAIAVSKLAAGGANTVLTANGTTNSFAQVTNAFVSASAAIAGTKISPDFGAQNIFTTGAMVAGDNTIATDVAGTLAAVNSSVIAYQYSSTASALATHSARRARGTRAAPSAVLNADSIGEYRFSGYDGSAYIAGARVVATVDTAPGAGSVPMTIALQTGTSLAALVDRISFTSSGLGTMTGPLQVGTVTPRATAGAIFRSGHNTSAAGSGGEIFWKARNAANTQDVNLTWFGTNGLGTNDVLWIGDNIQLQQVAIQPATQLTMGVGSTTVISLSAGAANVTQTLTLSNATPIIQGFGLTGSGAVTGKTVSVRGGGATGDSTGAVAGGPLDLAGGSCSLGTTLTPGEVTIRGGTSTGVTHFANVAFHVTPGTVNYQTGEKIIYIGNAAVLPTGNPVSGGFLYVDTGALKYRGSGGTITTLGAA